MFGFPTFPQLFTAGVFCLGIMLGCAATERNAEGAIERRAAHADSAVAWRELSAGPRNPGCYPYEGEAFSVISSAGQLAGATWQSEQCRDEFMNRMTRSGVNFDREAIVVLRHVYGGTGMARARYTMSGPEDGVLTCSIGVIQPDGPSTPNTAFFVHGFVVSKAEVSAVRIVDLGQEAAVLPVAP